MTSLVWLSISSWSFLFFPLLLILLLYLQVAKFKDPRDACAAIVAESYKLWLQYETRTDDITVIVVHVNGLTDVRGLAVQTMMFFCA